MVPVEPGLIVGKAEGGGKLEQGSDDDKPGGGDQQQEQGVDDDSAPGRAMQASPEPFQGPGKLLGEQEDDEQKTGIKKDGPDNGIPEAHGRKGAPVCHRRQGKFSGGVVPGTTLPPMPPICL
jgi:hypothetical protein